MAVLPLRGLINPGIVPDMGCAGGSFVSILVMSSDNNAGNGEEASARSCTQFWERDSGLWQLTTPGHLLPLDNFDSFHQEER